MMRGGVGRTREFRRGVHLPVPDAFELPTCESCGEILMAPEVSEPLDALLAARYPKLAVRDG